MITVPFHLCFMARAFTTLIFVPKMEGFIVLLFAGIGGDKITIYDDTEDSESDFEEEEEEEEEVTSEEDDDEIGETDIVESSLRCFLSKAQEWLPKDSMEVSI